MFDTNKIEKNIKKIQKSVVSTVKKTMIGIFSFLTIVFTGVSVMLFLTNIPIISSAISIFFGFLAFAFLVLDASLLISLSGAANGKDFYNYRKEILSCEKILSSIKKIANSKKDKGEYLLIYNQLSESLENAKSLSKKIDSIRSNLKLRDWDINYVEEQILLEKQKPNSDARIIERLEEQKNNIEKLIQKENQLTSKLALLKTNFSSIYTKITLLSASDDEKTGFDEIETEIQKNLDFKLKVSKYEDELEKELER